MTWRELITINCQGGGISVGDNMQVVATDDGLYFTVENPWAGSTETGFGYTTNITLKEKGARDLVEILQAWLAHQP